VFCGIVAGAPAHRVLDEGPILAFLDTSPLFPGHVLVVPKTHVPTLVDLPDALTAPLFTAVRRIARALEACGAGGSFVATNTRVSQSVPHLHVHVVPRTRGDGLRGFFWPRVRYESGQAEAWAQAIRHELFVDPQPPD
jgi:histidine triad (HIT) family protein